MEKCPGITALTRQHPPHNPPPPPHPPPPPPQPLPIATYSDYMWDPVMCYKCFYEIVLNTIVYASLFTSIVGRFAVLPLSTLHLRLTPGFIIKALACEVKRSNIFLTPQSRGLIFPDDSFSPWVINLYIFFKIKTAGYSWLQSPVGWTGGLHTTEKKQQLICMIYFLSIEIKEFMLFFLFVGELIFVSSPSKSGYWLVHHKKKQKNRFHMQHL